MKQRKLRAIDLKEHKEVSNIPKGILMKWTV